MLHCHKIINTAGVVFFCMLVTQKCPITVTVYITTNFCSKISKFVAICLLSCLSWCLPWCPSWCLCGWCICTVYSVSLSLSPLSSLPPPLSVSLSSCSPPPPPSSSVYRSVVFFPHCRLQIFNPVFANCVETFNIIIIILHVHVCWVLHVSMTSWKVLFACLCMWIGTGSCMYLYIRGFGKAQYRRWW